jgi:cytochrome d ubiquinol oxidase subunit II
MTTAEVVAGVLLLVIIVYACTGIADYGAGFWDLTAGGRDRGRRPRELIDAAVTPVWEANHVWLIFLLILCWTAFGPAFASITTTLFVPLAVALLGIVLRAASFAMRKDAARAGARHLAGYLFGAGSVLTPFFLGAALGGLLSGRVPEGNAAGNELTSWFNPTSLAIGLLVLLTGAFLSAVYLIAEARRRGAPDLQGYFRIRAVVAGVGGLVAGGAALGALLADQRTMFDRVIGRSWPLLVLGVLALAATFCLGDRAVSVSAAVLRDDQRRGRGPAHPEVDSRLRAAGAAHRRAGAHPALRPGPAGRGRRGSHHVPRVVSGAGRPGDRRHVARWRWR